MIFGRVTGPAIPEADEAHDRFLIVNADELTPFDSLRDDLADELRHADAGSFRFPLQSPVL